MYLCTCVTTCTFCDVPVLRDIQLSCPTEPTYTSILMKRKLNISTWNPGYFAELAALQRGALIVTGHAHTYSRTHEMARFGNKVYGHTNKVGAVGSKLHPGLKALPVSSFESLTPAGLKAQPVSSFDTTENDNL